RAISIAVRENRPREVAVSGSDREPAQAKTVPVIRLRAVPFAVRVDLGLLGRVRLEIRVRICLCRSRSRLGSVRGSCLRPAVTRKGEDQPEANRCCLHHAPPTDTYIPAGGTGLAPIGDSVPTRDNSKQ